MGSSSVHSPQPPRCFLDFSVLLDPFEISITYNVHVPRLLRAGQAERTFSSSVPLWQMKRQIIWKIVFRRQAIVAYNVISQGTVLEKSMIFQYLPWKPFVYTDGHKN